ncbi:MAG: hypothetical protein IKZ73_02870, partial [Lachnospiraceae bacterium]|nr:hypothetical protein [Lachnospiraceae bacterium]
PVEAKVKVVPTYPQVNGAFVEGDEAVYGLNLEKFLERINGFETSSKYCIAFTSITENYDNINAVVKYIFDIK